MGFYPPDALVHEAQRRGIEVLPPDVNRSDVECTVETPRPEPPSAVRIGLGYITGLRDEDARALVAERERGGPYASLADLASRSGVGREALELLAWAGACEAIGGGDDLRRREDLWQLGVALARGGWCGATASRRRPQAPVQLSLPLPIPAAPSLRELDSWERLVADYASTGIAIAEHPMALHAAEPRAGGRPRAPTSTGSGRQGRGDRRDGGRPPAARDRARGRLHAARGRAGDGQRGRPAARLRAPSPGGEDGVVRAGERKARAPRRGHQRGRLGRSSPRHARRSRRRRSGTSSRPPSGRRAGARPASRGGDARAAELAAVAPAAHSFGRRGR